MRRRPRFNLSNQVWRLLVLMIGVGVVAAPATAGQQDASIIGQVTDESGAVLPGVTVTTTSPALQREVTIVTNERGEYRLAPLPIGTYEVVYTLTGFQTIRRENVRLTVGFVAKLDETMKVGALAETVTVSGASPVVDVTSTSTSTQLTRETLELTPTGRNSVYALAVQAPGVRTAAVDVGGSQINLAPRLQAYGQVGESWTTIEGVMVASPKAGQSGNYFDYASFEETQVEAIGKGAAVPVRGIAMTAIVKSGGNDFHGGAFYGGTNKRFQSANIDDKLAAQGITAGNPLQIRWDVSGEVGGRIIRDKLWFYGSTRKRKDDQAILNAFKPDGSSAIYSQNQGFLTGKVNYQVTSANRLVGYYGWSLKHYIAPNVNVFVPWESRTDEDFRGKTTKAEWQFVKGNFVTTAQTGGWGWRSKQIGHADGRPSTADIATQYLTGDNDGAGTNPGEYRFHTLGSVGWYKADWFHGNHEFKAGVDHLVTTINRAWVLRDSGDYILQFNNGAPFQIVTYNSPVDPITRTGYVSGYVTDNWTIGRRLTLNLGARYAHDKGYVPAQCREAGPFARAECTDGVEFKIFNSVAPRVAAAYDVTGSGKTVIKAGWGRFNHMRYVDEVTTANPFLAVRTTYLWRDLNGNRRYEAGEFNPNPNGPDFVTQGGTARAVPNPDERVPKVDTFTLSLERELIPNFAVRVSGIYSRTSDDARRVRVLRPYEAYNIPITRPDPGPDGRVGTADDPGTSMTYWDFPAAYAGEAFEVNMLAQPPGQSAQTFRTIEVSANKRFSTGWQLNASYSGTKKNIPVPETVTYDPNAEIFTADRTWEWLIRVSGTYVFPYDVSFSANLDHRSGDPQARQVLFTGGRQIPSIVLNVEPIGSLRLPNINNLDLRVEKAFRLANGQKLGARLNVFNSLNVNSVLARSVRSGASFLRATSILPPRIFELSATYSF